MTVSFQSGPYTIDFTFPDKELHAHVYEKSTGKNPQTLPYVFPFDIPTNDSPIKFVAALKERGYYPYIENCTILFQKQLSTPPSNEARSCTKHLSLTFTLNGCENGVSSLLQPEDGVLLTGSFGFTIQRWNLETGNYTPLEGHTDRILGMVLLKNDMFASGSADGTIRIWDLCTNRSCKILRGNNGGIASMALLNNDVLASGSTDGTIQLWDLESGKCRPALNGHTDVVNALITLENGNLASGSSDCTIKIWDPNTGTCLHTFAEHTEGVTSLIKLSNHRLASGSIDRTIKLWKVGEEASLRTFTGHTNPVLSLCALQDDTLVSGSSDKSIRLWNQDSENCLQIVTGHTGGINSLIRLRNGCLASGSWDKTVKLWVEDKSDFKATSSIVKNILKGAEQGNQQTGSASEAADAEIEAKLQQIETRQEERFHTLLQKQEIAYRQMLNEMHSEKCADHEMEQIQSYATVLEEALREHNASLTDLADHQFKQIQQSIDRKLGPQLEKALQKAIKSEPFQQQMRQMQEAMVAEISDRQSDLSQKLEKTRQKLRRIQDKQGVLYQKYLVEQRVLEEQQELQNHPSVLKFYNTVEKHFSAKLMTAMTLVSGMIVREETTLEKRAQMGSNVVQFLCGYIPVVGSGLGTVIGFGIEKGAEIYASKREEMRYNNVFDSSICFKDAMTLSELAARRTAQRYVDILKSLTPEQAESAGEKAANAMYDFLQEGKLKPLANKPTEEQVAALVAVVDIAAEKKTGLIKKSGGIFEQPLSPAHRQEHDAKLASVAGHTDKVVLVSQKTKIDVDRLKTDFEQMKRGALKMTSLHEEHEKRSALRMLNERGQFSEHRFIINRTEKNISIQVKETKDKAKDKETLNKISFILTSTFASDVIEDTRRDSKGHVVITRSSIIAEEVEALLREWLK